MKTYCICLGYNLPSEIKKSVDLLYKQNDPNEFQFLLLDLGFPLSEGDQIPVDIEVAKAGNSLRLVELATQYNAMFIQRPNVGVSQNWQTAIDYLSPIDDTDIIIGLDPDERPMQDNWVRAIRHVFDARPDVGVVSLSMPEQQNLWDYHHVDMQMLNGEKTGFFTFPDITNWALIGISGKFLNIIKKVPYPANAPIYGWLEFEIVPKLYDNNMHWCMLPDYQVYHTDYPKDEGSSMLLREWKNQMVHHVADGQIDFEKWLINKRDGK